MEDMIAEGLSQLGRSADGTLQVYLNLFLAVGFVLASTVELSMQATITCKNSAEFRIGFESVG